MPYKILCCEVGSEAQKMLNIIPFFTKLYIDVLVRALLSM